MPKESPTFAERLLTNPWFLLIANVASILGLVVAVVLWNVEVTPKLVAVRDSVIAISMLLLTVSLTAVSVYLGFRLSRLRELRVKARTSHLIGFHRIVETVRDECWKSQTSADNEMSPAMVFQTLCTKILSDTRSLIIENLRSREIEIGDDVALTLKMVLPVEQARTMLKKTDRAKDSLRKDDEKKNERGTERLVTMARDEYTMKHRGADREILEWVYSIWANTAFIKIIGENDDNVYVENDLKSLQERGAYRNENDDWRKHYNSTIVVPVRYKPETSSRSMVLGLLCVDSKNESGFELYNKTETFDILGHSADLIALLLFFVLEKSRQESESARSSTTHQSAPSYDNGL